MPVERPLRRLLIFSLALPVFGIVYATALVARLWALVRPPLATVLGATVIGSVYAEVAWSHAPAPVRVAPIRAAAVMALALVMLTAGLPAAPTRAANPLAQALDTAHQYIGTPYKLGAERSDLVDCSGLIYRIFADIGELPRIGGRRMRAMGYYRWFAARGLATTDKGEPGDLVVYKKPNHIGVYLGDGRVLSALVTGVKIHALKGINARFIAFLKVNYNVGDPEPTSGETPSGGKGGKGKGNKPSDPGQTDSEGAAPRGFAIGTMNLRADADPRARIVGWISRGTTFTVLGKGTSPSGAEWWNVRARNGREGWVYSRWARTLEP